MEHTMTTTVNHWEQRYATAQSMLHAASAVANASVFPHWLDDHSFWYRRRGDAGLEYRIVDAATGEVRTAFTHAAVTLAMSSCAGTDFGAQHPSVVVQSVDYAGGEAILNVQGVHYAYSAVGGSRELAGNTNPTGMNLSPDGRLGAFLGGNDLWIRILATGEERALTHDGEERNAYGVKPAAIRRLQEDRADTNPACPEGCWSPDSRRFLTLQTDERHVPPLPLIDFAPPDGIRPVVIATPTSVPGDTRVTEFRIVSIDVETGAQTEPDYRRLTAVRMNDTPFSAGLTWWDAAGSTAYFVDITRGERSVHVVEFDVASGRTRRLLSEYDDERIDLGPNVYEPALVRALPETNELIWYSERSGHGHLYLYDLMSGELKRPITAGQWQVRELLHVDPNRRDLLILAAGIVPGGDPYISKPCTVSLDTGHVRVVSDEPGDHIIWMPQSSRLALLGALGEEPTTVAGVSPSGAYFIETVGRVDDFPRTVLRRRTGDEISVLETAEDRGLPGEWTWPEPVALTAADGVTVTHGLLFKPNGYEAAGSYPVIDLIYGGPQMSFVPKSAFAHGGVGTDLQLLEAAHLATLGAFVLILDGRGTAGRERSFAQASYGALHTASNLEDHVAALNQLAERYPSMDLDRVGVCGFSAGGYAAAHAALRYGHVFKVCVAGGGNYDQRLFWHTWGERFQGDDPDAWVAQAAKTYASALSGKLLLIHGLLDPACSPGGMFQLTQALIEANRDFDLVIEPRGGHQLGGYALRRRLDYLVTHLFRSAPPVGLRVSGPFDEPPFNSTGDKHA
jgi:dipeptidyl aminopeptidase/acylaminoacyl peptidase